MEITHQDSLIMHSLLYASWGIALAGIIISVMIARTWNKKDKPKEPDLRSFEFI